MKSSFIILLLSFPLPLLAQNNLRGTVSNSSGKPLDAATITISQNGSIVATKLSSQGKFSHQNLNAQPYQLYITSTGYQPFTKTFTLPKDSLLNIILQDDTRNLKEVQITYHPPTIERKTDRVVFNVENSILASGGNVYEALKKAPGVNADDAGSITANSKSATVYIDDRPVRMSGEDLALYLQSLPAENISKIEVMTVPGAKYDAQGGAVINIVSKKSKGDGFNMTIGSGYTRGRKDTYRGNNLFNYRKDKLNIYGSYSYQDRNTRNYATYYDIFTTPDSYSYWDKERTSNQNSRSGNYSLGLDYSLTKNQLFGFIFTGNNSVNTSGSLASARINNDHKIQADSVLQTDSYRHAGVDSYTFNLNYNLKLDTTGQRLNIDVDYVPFRNQTIQNLNNLSFLPDGTFASPSTQFETPASQKINIWSAKADYEVKLWKSVSLESGLKYTGTSTGNIVDFFITSKSLPIKDPLRSDIFSYKENTAALYTSLAADLGKWSLKAGLRAENTYTEGYSIALDSLNKNEYLRLFPTAYITYKVSKDNTIQLNYDKRIDRPDYVQLNPARTYSTPYSYSNGNPFLKPAITNNFELTYVYKNQYTVELSYTNVNDKVFDVTVQDNVTKTYHDSQQNLGAIKDFGVVLMATHHPFPWWEITSYFYGAFRKQTQRYLNDAEQNTFNYSGNTTSSFTINQKAGLKAEVRAAFQNGFHIGPLNFASTNDISAGLSKKIFNDQGTLRFSAADILYGNPYRININYLNQQNGGYLKSDSRNFTLTFTYKLGKNVAEARKRKTAAEEEKSRAAVR